MKKVGESLMGPEEERSDFEEQASVESDRTREEAYGASQHDKDVFIRFVVEKLQDSYQAEHIN